MLTYRFDPRKLEIQETADGDDAEFDIRIPDGSPLLEELKKVKHDFESNKDLTDVLFYLYPEHRFKIFVRREHYATFLAELVKRRLIEAVEWKD